MVSHIEGSPADRSPPLELGLATRAGDCCSAPQTIVYGRPRTPAASRGHVHSLRVPCLSSSTCDDFWRFYGVSLVDAAAFDA